ncbi:MAG: isochorismatase family protein [Planctomycetota bacterium]
MHAFDLATDRSQLLVVDMQERFRRAIPAIDCEQDCGRNARILVAGAATLELPVLFTEQVPDKLGPTLSQLRAPCPDAPVLAKQAFSVLDDDACKQHLAAADRGTVIVAGIEAHICLLATVDDLLRHGYHTVVAADAIASRRGDHCSGALATMRQLGALVVPVESILFRLQRLATGASFKAISQLIR